MQDALGHLIGQGRGGDLMDLLIPVIFVAIYGLIALANRAFSKKGQAPSSKGDQAGGQRRYKPLEDERRSQEKQRVATRRAQRLPYAQRGQMAQQPRRQRPTEVTEAQSARSRHVEEATFASMSRLEAKRTRQEQLALKYQQTVRQATMAARRKAKPAPSRSQPSVPPTQTGHTTEPEVPDKVDKPGEPFGGRLLTALRRTSTVRAAIVYSEVLGPCVALRDDSGVSGPTGLRSH